MGLVELLEKKYLVVKTLEFHSFFDIKAKFYPEPRSTWPDRSDVHGPREIKLINCYITPDFSDLWKWLYALPTLRTLRLLGDDLRFVDMLGDDLRSTNGEPNEWAWCYFDHDIAKITTLEMKLHHLHMISTGLDLVSRFRELQHLELDLSCHFQIGEEDLLTRKDMLLELHERLADVVCNRNDPSLSTVATIQTDLNSFQTLPVLMLLSLSSTLPISIEMEMGVQDPGQMFR